MSESKVLQAWTNASYGTHSNMKEHTGGVISTGNGFIHHKLSKQKINMKSLTE